MFKFIKPDQYNKPYLEYVYTTDNEIKEWRHGLFMFKQVNPIYEMYSKTAPFAVIIDDGVKQLFPYVKDQGEVLIDKSDPIIVSVFNLATNKHITIEIDPIFLSLIKTQDNFHIDSMGYPDGKQLVESNGELRITSTTNESYDVISRYYRNKELPISLLMQGYNDCIFIGGELARIHVRDQLIIPCNIIKVVLK